MAASRRRAGSAGRAPAACRRRGAAGALGLHELAHRRRDLVGEAAHGVGVVAPEHVGAHAHLERQLGQLLGPVVGRALQEAAARAEPAGDVVEAPDRPGAAPRLLRSLVDGGVEARERGRLCVAHAGQPPVGELPGHPEHAGLVGAEPDLDVVERHRAGAHPRDRVVLTVDAHRPLAAPGPVLTPRAPDDPRSPRRGHRRPPSGVRRSPPAATMASQKAPVPRPSSARPPLTRSRVAICLARPTGGRSGRFATLCATRIVEVRAATAVSRVEASRCAAL